MEYWFDFVYVFEYVDELLFVELWILGEIFSVFEVVDCEEICF